MMAAVAAYLVALYALTTAVFLVGTAVAERRRRRLADGYLAALRRAEATLSHRRRCRVPMRR